MRALDRRTHVRAFVLPVLRVLFRGRICVFFFLPGELFLGPGGGAPSRSAGVLMPSCDAGNQRRCLQCKHVQAFAMAGARARVESPGCAGAISAQIYRQVPAEEKRAFLETIGSHFII